MTRDRKTSLRLAPDDPQFLEITHKLRQENVDRWLMEEDVYSGISTETLMKRIEVDRIVCELAREDRGDETERLD